MQKDPTWDIRAMQTKVNRKKKNSNRKGWDSTKEIHENHRLIQSPNMNEEKIEPRVASLETTESP